MYGETKNNGRRMQYKELDRYLKEQFINCLNDDGMVVKIIRP